MRKIRTAYVVYCDGCDKDIKERNPTPNATLENDEFYFCPDCLAKIRAALRQGREAQILPKEPEVPEVSVPTITEDTEAKENEITLVKNDDARFIKAGLNGKVWTPATLNELLELCKKNYTLKQLAEYFGKDIEAMRSTMNRIRNAKPGSDFYPVTRELDRVGYSYPTGAARRQTPENLVIEAAIGLENGEKPEQLAARIGVSVITAYRYRRLAKAKGLVPEKKGARFI